VLPINLYLFRSETLNTVSQIELGTLTPKSARRPRELLFAAIPLLFAIQQLREGVIWLAFRYEAITLLKMNAADYDALDSRVPSGPASQR